MSLILIALGIYFIIGASITIHYAPQPDDRLPAFTGFVLLCIGIALVIAGASWNCGG